MEIPKLWIQRCKMEFGLNDEQSLVVKTVRNFVENEIYP